MITDQVLAEVDADLGSCPSGSGGFRSRRLKSDRHETCAGTIHVDDQLADTLLRLEQRCAATRVLVTDMALERLQQPIDFSRSRHVDRARVCTHDSPAEVRRGAA